MGFWIFMLCFTVLIPLIMIIFGKVFSKTAPKNINYLFGYRTNRSMKNQETWNFAHKVIGKIWWIWGIVILIVSVVVLILFVGADNDTIGNASCIIIFAQLIFLFITIFFVERKLKKNFDDDGNPLN